MPVLLRRILHYLAYVVGGMVIVFSVIALTLRLVVMPDIDSYRPDLEALATRAVGLPVRIGVVEADWRHLNPRLALHDVQVLPPGRSAPLVLQRVNATLSWLSLPLWEPHLARLDLLNPEITARRDPEGRIFIAGVPVNQPGPQSPFPDWLLRQRDVTVTGGRLVWQDDYLAAPPLILEKLNLHLVNLLGRHRFGLTAEPPPDSVRRLDLRGDLQGDSIHARDTWQGRLYLNVEKASAEALLRWAPWAQRQVKQGSGDTRAWLDLKKGQIRGVNGDVRLTRVAVSLADDLPDMSFQSVSGHLDWHREKGEHILRIERLHFVSSSGETADPALVDVRIKPTTDGKVETARVSMKGLRLEALTALSHTLPLPDQIQDLIARHNPRGYIDNIEVAWLGSDRFRINSKFRDAGLSATPDLPGFSGLDGEIEADEGHGRVRFASKGLHFSYDRIFRQPLSFQHMEARLSWTRSQAGGTRITLERGELGNADLDGTVFGSLDLAEGKAPVADIRAQLSRGEGNAVWKYLPWQVSDDTYDWVKHSIRSGTSPNTRFVLRGPLDQFPFSKGGGEFLVATKIDNAVLDYADGWPAISGIDGWLIFKEVGMTVTTSAGRILDIPLAPVKAVIADLYEADATHLVIEGGAAGPANGFIEFTRQSPLFDYIGRTTADLKAEGMGKLRLRLDLPLHDLDATKVKGEFTMAGTRLEREGGWVPLTDIYGTLSFTEGSIHGQDIKARVLGEPALINLASGKDGHLRGRYEGRMQAKTLAGLLPAAFSRYVSGHANLRFVTDIHKQDVKYSIESDLVGLDVQLPPPFGKTASQARRLVVRGNPEEDDEPSLLRAQYGDLLTVGMTHPGTPDARIGLLLGTGEPLLPDRAGIKIHGALQKLDLDAWQGVWEKESRGDGGQSPPIHDINLSFNEVKVYNRRFHETNVHANPVPHGWRLVLSGQEVQGEAVYDEPGGLPGKRLVGRFKKFQLPLTATTDTPAASTTPMELPRLIDISAESFSYASYELGAVATTLSAEGNGLRINNLSLNAPEARLEGSGWLSASSRRATELSLKLEAKDTGRMLNRLDIPDGIQGGAASISGHLNWMGRFEDFQKANLNGRLKIDMKKGRFTRMDPGVGRLLGVLSLQSLPRRVTLDFGDVFSSGFAFDSIVGDVHIERGVLYLPALQINGPSAKVHMNGKVDTVAQTQNLRLLVEPRLEESAALAGALLGGPVVGLGALVASKVLQDPLAKAASFEYMVTGSWTEPTVTKMAKQQPSVQSLP